eukprot:COSAG06_NODE_36974_length_440_cov_25.882698_1_plen_73_part_00
MEPVAFPQKGGSRKERSSKRGPKAKKVNKKKESKGGRENKSLGELLLSNRVSYLVLLSDLIDARGSREPAAV